eukprot:5697180-Alexandrium_andersonii.AAC.1
MPALAHACRRASTHARKPTHMHLRAALLGVRSHLHSRAGVRCSSGRSRMLESLVPRVEKPS